MNNVNGYNSHNSENNNFNSDFNKNINHSNIYNLNVSELNSQIEPPVASIKTKNCYEGFQNIPFKNAEDMKFNIISKEKHTHSSKEELTHTEDFISDQSMEDFFSTSTANDEDFFSSSNSNDLLEQETFFLKQKREGNDELNKGNDELNKGNDELNKGNDELNKGNDEINKGDYEINESNQEASQGIEEEHLSVIYKEESTEKTNYVKNEVSVEAQDILDALKEEAQQVDTSFLPRKLEKFVLNLKQDDTLDSVIAKLIAKGIFFKLNPDGTHRPLTAQEALELTTAIKGILLQYSRTKFALKSDDKKEIEVDNQLQNQLPVKDTREFHTAVIIPTHQRDSDQNHSSKVAFEIDAVIYEIINKSIHEKIENERKEERDEEKLADLINRIKHEIIKQRIINQEILKVEINSKAFKIKSAHPIEITSTDLISISEAYTKQTSQLENRKDIDHDKFFLRLSHTRKLKLMVAPAA